MDTCSGKVAVVTGAGRGIGFVIASYLLAEGATVYVPDLDGERSTQAANQLGEGARPATLDVRSAQDVKAFFARVDEEAGGADLLVNCAGGYAPLVPTLNITEDEYDMVMDSNLKGTFLCCQAAIPSMLRKHAGAILNFSSLAGRQTSPALGSPYTSAKAGVLGLTRHFAKEFGAGGVRVNAVAPGTTEGERVAGLLTPEDRERQLAGIPLGRFTTAEDLADVAVFLLSDRARYITGATIDVNGGVLTI
ncbi:SDR family NAD(P)-dependent oxidoreductase [Paraburkholderia sp. C35]|uniref:SDR family NAD(P)-dependent oxidoreductase n=1 Tax=Paraburkholderia sp. C35 TaxID=2126993 RepID=UPI000D692546|nr:SDR family NAD(P)-dependent oxidoreductase [Paraburkholderia sp. C35]